MIGPSQSTNRPVNGSLASQLRAVFDKDWYLQENPDVAHTAVDALTHYLRLGGFEGRDPNPLFDSDWYLQTQCPEAGLAGINPLIHYLQYGAAEGLDPHPLFDTSWYVEGNPDLPAGMNPLAHYVKIGATEGRPPSKLFVESMALPATTGPDAVVSVRRGKIPGEPKVSVVIPVFNKAAYLSECLNSVLGQSLTDIEIICVNDGSNDRSLEILEAYYQADGRITLISSARRLGAATARNIGINCSRGEYLQFTDADDMLPPAALEKLYDTARADGTPLVRGGLAIFVNSNDPADPMFAFARNIRANWSAAPELSVPYCHTTYLLARDLVVRNEISYPDLIDGEDEVFIARLLVNTSTVSTIPDMTYLYRIGGGPRRKSLLHLVDFIRQAAAVRSLYMRSHPEAWTGGYLPFLADRFREVFLRSDSRPLLERVLIGLALKGGGLANDFSDLDSRIGNSCFRCQTACGD